jgi:hypothetical protein
MEFTPEGLELVKTSNFAQTVDAYLSSWREQGTCDLELRNLLAGTVSWAATGHVISEPPAGKQSYELTAFVLGHLKEVDDLCDTVGNNILDLVRGR